MFKLFYTISVLSANHWIIFDYIIASSHSFKLRFKRSRHAKSGNSNSIVTDFELQISLAILIVLAAFLFKSPSKAWTEEEDRSYFPIQRSRRRRPETV
ncbi:hypothetical protein IC575_002479 [Cucumis melo]